MSEKGLLLSIALHKAAGEFGSSPQEIITHLRQKPESVVLINRNFMAWGTFKEKKQKTFPPITPNCRRIERCWRGHILK